MSQQSGLFDSAPPVPTDRLFLGLFPDSATAARIRALTDDLCRRHDLRSTPLAAERLHVTLFHIGDWVGLPPDALEAARTAAARLRAAPVELRFDEVASFNNRRERPPLVLKAREGNAALHALRASLGKELAGAGLGRCVTASFEPHVTLVYARPIPAEAVEPIVWTAGEVVLIHSLLSKTTYIPQGRWALNG